VGQPAKRKMVGREGRKKPGTKSQREGGEGESETGKGLLGRVLLGIAQRASAIIYATEQYIIMWHFLGILSYV